jgi:hypothetical protein
LAVRVEKQHCRCRANLEPAIGEPHVKGGSLRSWG